MPWRTRVVVAVEAGRSHSTLRVGPTEWESPSLLSIAWGHFFSVNLGYVLQLAEDRQQQDECVTLAEMDAVAAQ